MRTLRAWTPTLGMALLALMIARCGGNDICLNCDAVPTPTPGPRDVITIEGSIDANNFGIDVTTIRVIACFDLDPSITDPKAFDDCPGKTQVEPDSDRNFTITNNLSTIDQTQASIRLGFWVPQQVIVDPVLIEDGDFFAELTEVESEVSKLEDVRLGYTAQTFPADVTFSVVPDETGFASTDRINVFITPDTTPTPSPTSTP